MVRARAIVARMLGLSPSHAVLHGCRRRRLVLVLVVVLVLVLLLVLALVLELTLKIASLFQFLNKCCGSESIIGE